MTVAQCPVLSNISNTSAEPVFHYTWLNCKHMMGEDSNCMCESQAENNI